ncbi:MAG: hypothetical protein ITG04_03595 [Proteiniphilum sp.]|nr:hypothetical protein [Proteiniphilum sp.]
MVYGPLSLLCNPVSITSDSVAWGRALMWGIDAAVINILPGRGVKTR